MKERGNRIVHTAKHHFSYVMSLDNIKIDIERNKL
jgi:hypothetical protein